MEIIYKKYVNLDSANDLRILVLVLIVVPAVFHCISDPFFIVRVQVPTPAFSCPSLIPSNPSVTTQIPSILQCYNPKIPSAPPSVAIQFPSFPSNLRLIGQVCSRKIKWQKEKCTL
ncbi:hypothetical protein ACTA71_004972 [Dictyostelium dimigraforme]